MRILEGHTGGVRALAYHPDGEMLASGGEDGAIVLWNLPSGKERSSLTEHTNWVRALAFSPTGKQLASASWDDRVGLWNLARRTPSHFFQGHSGGAWCVGFSPAGDRLATGAGDGFVHIYSMPSYRHLHGLQGHSRPVTEVVFAPNGKKLLSAAHDGTVQRWPTGLRMEDAVGMSVPSGWITCLALSANGRRFAVGTDEGRIFLHSLTFVLEFALVGHRAGVTRLAFTPDGQTLVSAAREGVVQLWDVSTGQSRTAFDWGLGPLLSLAVSPDGMTAAAGGANGQIVVWDLEE